MLARQSQSESPARTAPSRHPLLPGRHFSGMPSSKETTAFEGVVWPPLRWCVFPCHAGSLSPAGAEASVAGAVQIGLSWPSTPVSSRFVHVILPFLGVVTERVVPSAQRYSVEGSSTPVFRRGPFAGSSKTPTFCPLEKKAYVWPFFSVVTQRMRQ